MSNFKIKATIITSLFLLLFVSILTIITPIKKVKAATICTLTAEPLNPPLGTSTTIDFTVTFNSGISSANTPWYLYINPQNAMGGPKSPVINTQVVNSNDFPGGIQPYGDHALISSASIQAQSLAGNTYHITATWDTSNLTNGDNWRPQIGNNFNDECFAESIIFGSQTQPQLSSLEPAQIWVGLKNSDSVGTRFDLMAEVYKNDTELIGSGQIDNVWGGSSGFNNADLHSIPLTLTNGPVDLPSGSALSLKTYVRNACQGPTHNSGVARLWFDDTAANSQFGVLIDQSTNSYYLRNNFILSEQIGDGPKRKIDVQSGAPCSNFKPFGTWSITL